MRYNIMSSQLVLATAQWFFFGKNAKRFAARRIPDICQERQERHERHECKKIPEKNEKITVLGKYFVNLRTLWA